MVYSVVNPCTSSCSTLVFRLRGLSSVRPDVRAQYCSRLPPPSGDFWERIEWVGRLLQRQLCVFLYRDCLAVLHKPRLVILRLVKLTIGKYKHFYPFRIGIMYMLWNSVWNFGKLRDFPFLTLLGLFPLVFRFQISISISIIDLSFERSLNTLVEKDYKFKLYALVLQHESKHCWRLQAIEVTKRFHFPKYL